LKNIDVKAIKRSLQRVLLICYRHNAPPGCGTLYIAIGASTCAA